MTSYILLHGYEFPLTLPHTSGGSGPLPVAAEPPEVPRPAPD